MDNRSVLIVEDNQGIIDLLAACLKEEGYISAIAGDGETALRKLTAQNFTLVLLDLTLPGIDGLEVCRRMRHMSGIPVIIITGRPGREIESKCLETGADDFIQKPFTQSILMAHIKAVLRRTALQTTPSQKIAIDPAARTVTVAGRPGDLTRKEFDILGELFANEGKVVSYEDLLLKAWGEEYRDEVKYVQDCVRGLRHKIEPYYSNPQYIINVPGIGYRFSSR